MPGLFTGLRMPTGSVKTLHTDLALQKPHFIRIPTHHLAGFVAERLLSRAVAARRPKTGSSTTGWRVRMAATT